MSFIDDAAFLGKIDYIKFRSTFAVSIEESKFIGAKNFSGICCTAVSDHTQQVQFFVTIFAHFATPINEICLEPLSPSC